MNNRDLDILEKIIAYCGQIDTANSRLGNSLDALAADSVYKNAVAMCILQIGELVARLTEDFRQTYTGMPWQSIKSMRNLAAHHYGSFDVTMLWQTVTEDIPGLRAYCEEILCQCKAGE